MREGKLREIFEECLTAVLDGRRTVEDCLSLYPSVASELEPLLRTSIEISDAYQAESPPWHVQERIRHRVLAAAQARARGRTLVSGINLSPNSWRARHWGILGAAAAAAVATIFVVSLALFGGDGSGGSDGDGLASGEPRVAFELVTNLQNDLDELRTLLVSEGRIDLDQIERISRSTQEIGTQVPNFGAFSDLDEPTQQAIEDAFADIDEIFAPIVEESTAPEFEPVRQLLDLKGTVAGQFGEPDPETPAATDAPEPTVQPEPTDEPAVTGGPEPTPTKVPQPTQVPEPTDAPVEPTDPPRFPQ